MRQSSQGDPDRGAQKRLGCTGSPAGGISRTITIYAIRDIDVTSSNTGVGNGKEISGEVSPHRN